MCRLHDHLDPAGAQPATLSPNRRLSLPETTLVAGVEALRSYGVTPMCRFVLPPLLMLPLCLALSGCAVASRSDGRSVANHRGRAWRGEMFRPPNGSTSCGNRPVRRRFALFLPFAFSRCPFASPERVAAADRAHSPRRPGTPATWMMRWCWWPSKSGRWPESCRAEWRFAGRPTHEIARRSRRGDRPASRSTRTRASTAAFAARARTRRSPRSTVRAGSEKRLLSRRLSLIRWRRCCTVYLVGGAPPDIPRCWFAAAVRESGMRMGLRRSKRQTQPTLVWPRVQQPGQIEPLPRA